MLDGPKIADQNSAMDRLAGLSVFVQVADSGSYAGAARALGLTASAVGKAIVRLETRLDVRLFHRNTRNISLTADGEHLLDHCRTIMQTVAAAERDLTRARQGPTGRLRVSLPLASDAWDRVFLGFVDAYPGIDLELAYSNRNVDLIEEGFEAALRIGGLEDSRLRARRIGTFRFVLVASPAYLASARTPTTLDDLERHPCLRSRDASTCQLYPWPLGADAAQRSARLSTRLVADHNAMLVTAALNGAGIACLPEFWAREHIVTGALRLLLEEHTPNAHDVCAVWPASRSPSLKVAAFIDYAAKHLPTVI